MCKCELTEESPSTYSGLLRSISAYPELVAVNIVNSLLLCCCYDGGI